MKTADRFSDRVSNYVKYRPGYPPEMIGLFRREMGLVPESVVADVGCGPGMSSIPFLEFGCRVMGIEPNREMREAAREVLAGYPGFEVLEGSAEDTGLETAGIDIVIAAQAYHWFGVSATVAEFRRILKPGGYAALIWNERLLDATPFLKEYESLLLEFGTDYQSVRHDKIGIEQLERTFRTEFGHASFPNRQTFDFTGIKGRLMSSSYTPPEGDPRFPAMIENLREMFARHEENGKIQLLYDTNVFFTRFK